MSIFSRPWRKQGLVIVTAFWALVEINKASWSAQQHYLKHSQGPCLLQTDHLSLHTANYTLFVLLKLYILVQKLHTGHWPNLTLLTTNSTLHQGASRPRQSSLPRQSWPCLGVGLGSARARPRSEDPGRWGREPWLRPPSWGGGESDTGHSLLTDKLSDWHHTLNNYVPKMDSDFI